MRTRTIAPALIAMACAACGTKTRDPLATSLVPPVDASADAAIDAPPAGDDAGDDAGDLGRPCTDDPQCDDGVPCTYDSCDPDRRRCRNVPDDAQCDDGLYCDGREVCVAFHGCEPGPVVTCDDGDPCSIDACVEKTKACVHAARDADRDGDPDAHCAPHHDCDDQDPTVASTHSEVCANKKDDNCDGRVDENPCVTASNATCATGYAIGAPGSYALDTTGAPYTYPTSCSVSTPNGAHQVVAIVTLPAGAHDLDAWATSASGEVAVAIQGACGDAKSEVGCGDGYGGSNVRARGRSLSGTYAVLVTAQNEGPVTLAIDFLDPTSPPTNVDCASPAPITPGTSVPISLIDRSLILPTACSASVGELTYALTLAQPSDVRVFASTTRGSGAPVVGIRRPPCDDDAGAAGELRCHSGGAGSLPLFVRNLAAGTYVITAAATTSIDATLLVQTSAPTVAPPDQTCATAPAITPNALTPVDLSNNESAITDGCYANNPNAAFALPLASPSDVLLVGRFPEIEGGAVSLDQPACDTTSGLACTISGTPARASKRNVPAGDYRVVLTDTNGAKDTTLVAYVRDTVAPVIATGGDACGNAIEIPAAGGFFTGDTTNATPDFDDSCDSPTSPGGAPDQVLHLALAQPRHVVLDMSGSTYATILNVRQGSTCPGTEVPGDCYVGFTGNRSFLDLSLAAGDYWIVVDGYAGQKGTWNLDVRVLPP